MAHAPILAPTAWRYIERSIDRLVSLTLAMDEADRLTTPPVEGANCVAVLAGHTIANAEENLLGTLSGEAVVYDREADFATPATASVIEQRWADLRHRVDATLPGLDDASVLAVRTHPRRGEITGLDVLFVTARHAAEHLAQAEMTRDWLASSRR